MDETYQEFSNSILKKKFILEMGGDWKPCKNLSLQEAMEVYQIDYRSRLTQALGFKYEAVWSVLGDEDFFIWSEKFIDTYPSRREDLGRYGDEFPEFILNYPDFKFIGHLARLERLFDHVFHLASEKAGEINIENLENKHWEFVSTLRFFQSPFKVSPLWFYRSEENKPKFSLNQKEFLVLYKTGDEVGVQELEEAPFEVLHHLYDGKTLSEILEKITITELQISSLFEFIGSSGIVKN